MKLYVCKADSLMYTVKISFFLILYNFLIESKVVMELVDMNSLGLFDYKILSVQVGFTLYVHTRSTNVNYL